MSLLASMLLTAVLSVQAASVTQSPFVVTDDIHQQNEQGATDDITVVTGDVSARLKALQAKIFQLELALLDKKLPADQRAALEEQLYKLKLEYRKLAEAKLDAKAAEIRTELQDPALTDERKATLNQQLAAVQAEKKAQQARYPVLDGMHQLGQPGLSAEQKKALKTQLEKDVLAAALAKKEALQAQRDYLKTASADPALEDDPAAKAALQKELARNEVQLSLTTQGVELLQLRARSQDPNLTDAQRAQAKQELAEKTTQYVKDRIASLQKSLTDKNQAASKLDLFKGLLAGLKGALSGLQEAVKSSAAGSGIKLQAIPDVGDGAPATR